MIVAIQGEPGSFSDGAARLLVRQRSELVSCVSFDEQFARLTSGAADCAVVPVRNSTAGEIDDTARLLRAHRTRVIGHVRYPVNLCLIARRGTPIVSVRRVASHPMALRQCVRFLELSRYVPVAIDDTAGGVRLLVEGSIDANAVLASAAASELYGAAVLARDVQDQPDNFTEFVLVVPA